MFSTNYASQHEPYARKTINHILRVFQGAYTLREIKSLLIARDRLLRLEMEASHYLHHIVGELVDLFPHARFILTVREPLSWLNSEINQNMVTQQLWPWRTLESSRYERYRCSFAPEERTLERLDNVYPVSGYLRYWREHLEKVLRAVPRHRLLLVRTDQIRSSVPRLAEFLSIDAETIDLSLAHTGVNRQKCFDLTSHVHPAFVQQRVMRHCGEFMRTYFPDLPVDRCA